MRSKYPVPKTVFGGMIAMACVGWLALAGSTPAQRGLSGYHLTKTVKIDGPGGWDYLGIDSQSRRLFISHDTHVVVLDADTGDVAGDIADTPGVHGIAIAAEFGRGFTSNGRGNNVTIFDLKTLKTIDQVSTGKDPDAITYDPASHRVFTMDAESGSATAIDVASGKVAGTVKLPGRPEFAAADGHGAVFVNIESKSALAEIDSQTLRVTNQWPLAPCKSPSGMAMDTEHARLFIGCDNKMMAMIDAKSGKVITTLTVVHEDTPDKYTVVENVKTGEGARTMEVDPKTHNVYLMTAKLVPAKPYPKPAPGTLQLLIFAK